jgi:hypothetical protein
MEHLLDNIVWHTLFGAHMKYSVGTHEVRRYAKGFSPIVGFADPERPISAFWRASASLANTSTATDGRAPFRMVGK